MTSRERIEAALAHREADRIPVDLGASESSGIHGIAYNRLKAFLELKGGKTRVGRAKPDSLFHAIDLRLFRYGCRYIFAAHWANAVRWQKR